MAKSTRTVSLSSLKAINPMMVSVDQVFDALLAKLNCRDGRDANLLSHWQEGSKPGFRIQVSRKSDGKALTRFVDRSGVVSL